MPPKTARTPKAKASTTLPATTIIEVSRWSLPIVVPFAVNSRPPSHISLLNRTWGSDPHIGIDVKASSALHFLITNIAELRI